MPPRSPARGKAVLRLRSYLAHFGVDPAELFPVHLTHGISIPELVPEPRSAAQRPEIDSVNMTDCDSDAFRTTCSRLYSS